MSEESRNVADVPPLSSIATVAEGGLSPRPDIAELVSRQARRQPLSTAILHGEYQQSYLSLDIQSNRLAQALAAAGVLPGEPVGVALPRGALLVNALLAVLKAGAVYVPLAEENPEARLTHIVADTGMRLVLVDGRSAHRPALSTLRRFDVDGDEWRRHDGAYTPRRGDADALAYIMYTSGSTGTPKGVAVPQRGLLRLVCDCNYVNLNEHSVIAQISNPAFDAATFEFWGALCNGGRLVILDQDEVLAPGALAAAFRRQGVTTAFVTTALFNRLAHESPDSFATLDTLMFGGERASLDAVRRVIAAGKPARLLNVYGPTENTTFSTWCELDESHVARGIIPIGSPISGSQCYVVDSSMELQPVDAVGELLLGGDGLAAGYWNEPRLTAERFIAAPASWALPAGQRLYRTGDRVRRLASGALEFIDRLDEQIKLRGFRIEPGEIEHGLRQHPDVDDAQVTLLPQPDGQEPQLVAYCVSQEAALSPGGLRGFLAGKLPDYMLPSAYVRLAAFPLTVNGKLDRRTLPPPSPDDYARECFEMPAGDVELRLARLWENLLQRSPVGRSDNFLALGGNSLMLARLLSQIRHAFGAELSFRATYSATNLADMAASITQAGGERTTPELRRVDGAPAISHAQEALLFLDRLQGGDASYNLCYAFEMRGALDVSALEMALTELVTRHDSLRTEFDDVDGRFVARVCDAKPILELVAWPEDVPSALDAESLRPFDLAASPLVRARLMRGENELSLLFLSLHHIAADGWSMEPLFRDLSLLYSGHAGYDQGTPRALPIRYADYAHWQRGYVRDENQASALAYWQRQLKDLPLTHQLPIGAERTSEAGKDGAILRRRVSAELTAGLQRVAATERATLFMILHSAFAVLLSRWSGETDIVVGTPVANRHDAMLDEVVGYFVNTLVLRSDLGSATDFAGFLARNRATILDAFEHQELPFELLVEALNPLRDGHATPLFQIMFVLQNNETAHLRLPGLELRPLPQRRRLAKFELTLNAIPDDGGLIMEWEYQLERFEAATIDDMADGFLALLESLVREPRRSIASLPVFGGAARERLLRWSETAIEPVCELATHRLFEAQALKTPEACALRHGAETLGFATLDARAERLADYLRAAGIREGHLVGLCLIRTPAFIAAVLAVWKLGAAYLPLDPEQPASRHEFVLHDAGVQHVISQSKHGALGDSGRWLCLLDVAETQAAIDTAPRRGSRPPVPGHALAYVIYTSGSTGTPKGVLVEHRALTRLMSEPASLGYGPDTVMLQSINPAFDASILETWAPLCGGGQLVLYPGQGLEVSALRGLIADYGINTVTLPAALLDLWVEQLRAPTGLKRIVVGGEALSAGTVSRLYTLDPEVLVINHYGPTENGVLTSYYPIPRDRVGSIPIGWPVPGSQLYVCSEALNLQAPGVVGELCVAGQGLAREYLARPELNHEKFVAPHDDLPARRVYRTGDLVRWRSGGDDRQAVLEFVGRRDRQVKIRGFRIELGEIEAQLRACAGVADARVLVHQPADGDKQLLAYVIADEPARREAWRDQLRALLPAYMLPAVMVCIAAWPLTANGKVDTRALPAPSRDDYASRRFVAPESAMEKCLAAIWRELLKSESVGLDDSFFDLGGHSLLATRLHNRIRVELAIEVPLRLLFEAQTLRQQALRCEALLMSQSGQSASVRPWPAPVPVGGEDCAPLSYSQQRLWFIYRLDDADTAQYHMPLRMAVTGELQILALEQALADIVARHAILRTVFRERQGQTVQSVLPPGEFRLPVIDLSTCADAAHEAERRLRDEALRRFDLSRDRLLRACLIRLSPQRHFLSLTLHHIAADGWSMGILQSELSRLYAAHCRSEPAALAQPALQYADYAHWQQRWLTPKALSGQLEFWEKRLSGIATVHALPLDRPRPPVQTYHGAMHCATLPAALIARAEQLAHGKGATLFMVLHSAFALFLARYSGEQDIVVGTPVANRRDDALSPLMGLFINTLVLRSDLSGNLDFLGLLAQNREFALQAYDNQDLPLELLVERVNPPRSPAHGPLFQILFALQNNEPSRLELPGLACDEIPFQERYAKFELALNLQPIDGGLRAEWEYNTDLFDADSIAQMAACYETLLRAALEAPETPVRALPLLDEAARRHVLNLGNDSARPYPEDSCIPELVERHADCRPDAVAVIQGAASLSYGELNRQANRLAHYLRQLGAGPDIPVGISMERGLSMVVAMLAVLKAGSAYVPMDPAYPDARLASLLADCAPPIVLSQGGIAARLRQRCAEASGLASCRVLDVQNDAFAWSNAPEFAPSPADTGLGARNLAYIIYTSGSTGQPKGVMNEHRGIVNRLRWLQEAYPLGQEDRFLQTASFGFGASVVEIFWPLIAGIAVELVRPDGHKDPAYLAELIRRQGITALHFVPSMLRAFLDHPQARDCSSLTRIFCGGELLDAALARRCRELLPQARLYHFYGSSEAAVLSSAWECTGAPLPHGIPIGRPGANTRMHILDAHGQPVPRGMRGEIHVAGRQVARGYLNRPELTEKAFIPDPYGAAGECLFRSGDLGRQRADGNIEYLGRNDFQVKIRGQRIELGEIEAQLLACPGVRQAVVIAREQPGGDRRLVAYVLPQAKEQPHGALVDRLRGHVQAHLPSYMLPGAYVVLESFPLSANGKLDRKALPAPDQAASHADLRRPETPLQAELLTIWEGLLGEVRLGIDSDFFAAGGHSLMVLRLANRLRDEFAFELNLKAFFSAPTIEALAEAMLKRQLAQQAVQRFHDSDATEIVEF